VSALGRRTLGRTGLEVSPIGLGASYGIGADDVERAFDRGVNYFYWGSRRRAGFGEGIRRIARRDRAGMVVVVQSYARAGVLLRPSVESALRRLQIDRADLLLLGWWDAPPPDRIVDAALVLRETGKVGHLMVSCHHRPTFARYIADPCYGAIMTRYNAAHPGAEREVFPHLDDRDDPPGVVAYTATRWGGLLDPSLLPDDEPAPRASDCYRFALSNRHVDLCLAGPADRTQLDEALAAIERGPMDDDELAWMARVGRSVRANAMARRTAGPMRAARKLFTAITGQQA
jgi:aryl-alcohol dehydrogenase-like predicted oxidoreductase